MKALTLIPILLPTEDASNLFLNKELGLLFSAIPGLKNNPHHVYLCSTRPIMHGDCFYSKAFNNIKESAVDNYDGNECFRVEITTDSKLKNVKVIEGNTKATVRIESIRKQNLESYKRFINNNADDENKQNIIFAINQSIASESALEISEVNFLSEFVSRYNQKTNQKVDIEKLAEENADLRYAVYDEADEHRAFKNGFVKGFQASNLIQSNAQFSLEDMKKAIELARDGMFMANETVLGLSVSKDWEFTPDEIIQSLTKETPKGDIVIELNDGNLIFK